MSFAIEMRGVEKSFGLTPIIRNVNLAVAPGERHALIGPNGAGKSTTFNLISGYYRPTAGRLTFGGRDITGLSTTAVSRRGLVRTFQHGSLLRDMTVHDNILVGTMHSLRHHRDGEEWVREAAALLGLDTMLDLTAGILPH